MRNRVAYCGLILCCFLLFDPGTAFNARRASDSEEDEVEEYLHSKHVDLDKEEVLTETEEKTEIGDINGHKYVKKTKVISTIHYFGGKLEKRREYETDEEYCSRVFVQRSSEDYETFLSRVFNKYDDESVTEFVKRIETFRRLNPNCEAWYNPDYLELTKTYYTLTLYKLDFETWESYYDRVLTKRIDEDFDTYTKRISFVRKIHPEFTIWKSFTFDKTSVRGYTSTYGPSVTVIRRSLPVRIAGETEEEYCRRTFFRSSTDSLDTYYTTVFTLYSDETLSEYIDRIETIRHLYPDLPVWYDTTSSFTNIYNRILYSQLDFESDKEYIERILTKRANEDFDNYKTRVTVIYRTKPELDIWKTYTFDQTSQTGYTTVVTTSGPSFPNEYKETTIVKRSSTTDGSVTQVNEKTETTHTSVVVPGTKTTTEENVRIVKRGLPSTNTVYEKEETKTVVTPGSETVVTKTEEETRVKRRSSPGSKTVYEKEETKTVVTPGSETVVTKTEEETKVKRRSIPGSKTVYEKEETKTVVVPGSETVVTKTEEETTLKRRSIPGSKTVYEKEETKTVVVPGSETVVTKTQEETTLKRRSIPGSSTVYEKEETKTVVTPGSQTVVTKTEEETKVKRRSVPGSKTVYEKEETKTVVTPGSETVVTKTEEETTLKRRSIPGSSTVYEKEETKSVVFPGTQSTITESKTVVKRSVGESTNTETTTVTYVQKPGETDTDYYVRLTKVYDNEDDVTYVKRITTIRREYPHLKLWYDTTFSDYVKKFYSLQYDRLKDEPVVQYYKRLLTQEEYETDEEYQSKVVIIRKLFPRLDVWYSTEYLEYTRRFYSILYTQGAYETTNAYYQRIFTQLDYEVDEEYFKRITIIRTIYPNLNAWTEVRYLTYTNRYFRILYSQGPLETTGEYYTRLTKRSIGELTDSYVQRITITRYTYRELDVWYEPKYLIYVKDYYTLTYSQKVGEKLERYYQRLLVREINESNDYYRRRIDMICTVFPKLDVWYNTNFLIYTKEYYVISYSQRAGETENDYMLRVFQRNAGETDAQYMAKIQVIESVHPNLKAWYNKRYLQYSAGYYKLLFRKRTKESTKVWRRRLHELANTYTPKQFRGSLKIFKTLFPKFAAKLSKKHKEHVFRKKYHDAIKFAKNMWRKGDSSSSSSSDYSNYKIASKSSSSSSSSS